MKKVFFFIALSAVLLSSCKNFLEGDSFISDLEKSMEYARQDYVEVTISSPAIATKLITPAATTYRADYKKGDTITLNFVPNAHYKFTQWSAIPAGSVIFDYENEDEKNANAKATIIEDVFAVTIQPNVYEVPKVTVSPGNSVENPRNSAIVINFSQSMEIKENQLDEIKIIVDDLDAREHFEAPVVNSDNTQIIFTAKRDNLIPVGTLAKIVKVVVPENFYYLADGKMISLEEDFSYSFKINSKTEDKVDLVLSCPAEKGDLTVNGNQTLYLDDEFSVTVKPQENYKFSGWTLKYSDDTPVDDNILSVLSDKDDLTLKVKVLTGASRAISVTPTLEERAAVFVNFKADYGTVTPSAGKTYYEGDVINLKYKENGSYIFTTWKVLGDDNEEILFIEDKESLETTCEIKAGGETVTIEALAAERPTVMAITPSALAQVDRNSSIKVLFSQSMSESSIYWTKQELEAEGKTENLYELIPAEGKKDSAGNQYYYAYKEKGDNDGNTIKFKNIEIMVRSNKTNLLKYYSMPFFESQNDTLTISSMGGQNSVPEDLIVDIIIGSGFKSSNGVTVNQQYGQTFITIDDADTEAPKLNIEKVEISASKIQHTAEYSNSKLTKSSSGMVCKSNSTEEVNSTAISSYPKYMESGAMTVKITAGYVQDAHLDSLILSILPLKVSGVMPTGEFKTEKNIAFGNKEKYDFSKNPLSFTITQKDFNHHGVYKIQLSARDVSGQTTIFNSVFLFVNQKYDDKSLTSGDFIVSGKKINSSEFEEIVEYVVNGYESVKIEPGTIRENYFYCVTYSYGNATTSVTGWKKMDGNESCIIDGSEINVSNDTAILYIHIIDSLGNRQNNIEVQLKTEGVQRD